MKHHKHGMKVVENVLEIVSVDEMQFSFMPTKGTIDAIFISRRMPEEYNAKEKMLYMCFVDLFCGESH